MKLAAKLRALGRLVNSISGGCGGETCDSTPEPLAFSDSPLVAPMASDLGSVRNLARDTWCWVLG